MIDNSTYCIDTTKTRTWVYALIVPASLISRTFRVDGTFRSAGYIWISKISFYTSAGSCSVSLVTESIFPTWGRGTRIWSFCKSWRRCCNPLTSNKCISSVSHITFAKWQMIGDKT